MSSPPYNGKIISRQDERKSYAAKTIHGTAGLLQFETALNLTSCDCSKNKFRMQYYKSAEETCVGWRWVICSRGNGSQLRDITKRISLSKQTWHVSWHHVGKTTWGKVNGGCSKSQSSASNAGYTEKFYHSTRSSLNENFMFLCNCRWSAAKEKTSHNWSRALWPEFALIPA
jgi:hypothetical protein